MNPLDFHTHRLDSIPGSAIICLPRGIIEGYVPFTPQDGALYSVGVHPWWTDEPVEKLIEGVRRLSKLPQVVQIGEVGFDLLKGDFKKQIIVFEEMIRIAEMTQKSVLIHCVKAFDLLLKMHKNLQPTTNWTVHGFRGKPDLAKQLLHAGINLSYGPKFNPQSVEITPWEHLQVETDDADISITEVFKMVEQIKNSR